VPPPGTDDDLGFVADEDLGFVEDEPEPDPVIHADAGYSAPDPAPQQSARHLTLPETSFQVDPRGRRPDVVTEGTQGTLDIREARPAPPPPQMPAQPPQPAVRQTDMQRFMRDFGTQGPHVALGNAVGRMDADAFAGGVPAGAFSAGEDERAGVANMPAGPLARLARALTPESAQGAVRSSGLGANARALLQRLPGGEAVAQYAGGEGDIGDVYRSGRDDVRASQAARRERAPISFGAGEIAGQAPTMAVGGGSTVLGRVGTQAALSGGLGLIRGGGESEAEDVEGVASDALARGGTDAVLGGVLAGGGEVGSNLLGRLGSALARGGDRLQLPAARQRLAAGGISYEPDARLIDDPLRAAEVMRETGISRGLSSVRDAGERAQGVRRQANATITGLANDARSAAEQAMGSGSYRAVRGDAVPGTVRVEDLTSRLARLRDGISGQGAPNVAARQRIDDIIQRYTDSHPEGVVPIDDLMADWRAFGNPANFREGRPWDVLAGVGRDLRGEFRGMMESAMERASGPEARQQLAQSLERVHVARTAQTGAERVGRRGAGNRVLSLTDYITGAGALGGGGMAMGAGDPMTALAVGGGAVLANRMIRNREHAVAAMTLEQLSGGLRSLGTPQAQGWARTLDAARQRGQQSLAAAHYALSQQDPAYRQAVEAAQNQEEETPSDAY
jgi:hypothetical protein